MHSVLRSGPGWGFVLEIAFLARPMELSHSLTVICQRQIEGEESRGERREGAQSWPLTTHWTFPLSLHPEERFLLPPPNPRDVHTTGLVSLLWEMSDSTGVACPCGPCCAPTGLSLCWELGSGSALCWTARNVQSWLSYYYFMFIECLGSPDRPTTGWDRAMSPNSTLLRPL